VRASAVLALAALVSLAQISAAQADTFIVNVGGGSLTFDPQTITIHVGDTVTFRNKGGLHNVAADDHSFRCAHGCDGQGGNGAASSSSWAASVPFNQEGRVGYFCETHGQPGAGMYGTIVVLAQAPRSAVGAIPLGGWGAGLLLMAALALAAAARLRRRRSP